MQRLGKSLRSRSKRSALKLSYFSLVCVSEQLGPQPLGRSLVLAGASERTPAIIGSSICSQLHDVEERVSEKSSLLNWSFASGVSCETIRSRYRRSRGATSTPRHVIQVIAMQTSEELADSHHTPSLTPADTGGPSPAVQLLLIKKRFQRKPDFFLFSMKSSSHR